MSREQVRISQLYQGGKITKDDYDLLMKSVQRSGSRGQAILELLLNPFGRVAGAQALAIGTAFVIAMSACALWANVYYPGVLDFHLADPTKVRLTFPGLLAQNLVDCLTLAFLFYVGALIAKCRGTRLVDFLGTVFFSRYPYLLWTLLMLPVFFLFPGLRSAETKNLAWIVFIGIAAILFLCWQGATYFSALKESSGLRGKALWIVYIVSLALSEAITVLISIQLTRI